MGPTTLVQADSLGIAQAPLSAHADRLDTYPFTDVGNAQRLVAAHGPELRYCATWRKWLVWDGTRWKVDDTGEIERRAKETIRSVQQQALKIADTDQRSKVLKHGLRSESIGSIRAMVQLAQSEQGIPVSPSQLDANPYLLNCRNGTLDLKTGKIRESRSDDLITKRAPVKYDAKATCPVFDAFVGKIMGNDLDLIGYLQRVVGYTLTGDVSEKAIFFLHGDGNNGKTTFLEAIRAALGDYAGQVPIESLMAKNGDGISNDIARLQGLRFVTSSEAEQGRKLAESKVKQLTGMGTLQARFLYGEYFEFTPTFKIFMDANYKPEIRGTDEAIWDRIKLIPFTVSIPPKNMDRKLLQKLRKELPGILAWAVRGCLEWQDAGLGMAQAVSKATHDYREEMDSVSDFIDDWCELGDDFAITSADLHSEYKRWCTANREDAGSQKQLGSALAKKGFKPMKINGQRGWRGIKRKPFAGVHNAPEG